MFAGFRFYTFGAGKIDILWTSMLFNVEYETSREFNKEGAREASIYVAVKSRRKEGSAKAGSGSRVLNGWGLEDHLEGADRQ